MCTCANPKVPELFLNTCLKMTVPNRDGVPTLIRSKADAGKLHAGFADVRGSRSLAKETDAKAAPKKQISNKKSPKAKGKTSKEGKAGVVKDAVLVGQTGDAEQLSFFVDVVNLVEKATKHAVERHQEVIEQCVVFSLRYLLERSVRIPSAGKKGEMEEKLVQGDSFLLQATSSNIHLYFYL